MILPYTPPEEPLTTVAGGRAVVFPRGAVAAYRTVLRQRRGARRTRFTTAGLQLHVTI